MERKMHNIHWRDYAHDHRAALEKAGVAFFYFSVAAALIAAAYVFADELRLFRSPL
jgi:hypothetical protein